MCTVVGSTGALTLVGAGECVVTATAEGTDNYNEADTSYTVTVQATGTLVLNLVEPIATDNVINAAEKKLGFKISGDTGAVGGVGVTVTVGGTDLPATSADADPATWSVSVPADASDITGTSLALRVSAAKAGYDSPADVERTLTVDLVAPTAPSYTAPSSLQVGVEITAMSPSGGSDIAEYSAAGLPSGLTIGTGTGAISGTPDTAEASTAGVTVTVTVSDTAGNTDTVDLTFPAVGKGDQPLSGFAYSADSVTFGSPAPTVTEPTGGQTNLSYLAPPETVCTVNPSTGALTIVGVGTCVITATAEGTDNYNEATARFTVTVQAAGALVLNLVEPIATDNVINAAEKKLGFSISGDTGTESGVSVTVVIGTETLTVTSADDSGIATWSVNVPADASDITGTSVAVEVTAKKTGYTAPSAITRTLTVDLVAPTAPSYTAPSSLQVGVEITAMSPSGGIDIDEYSAAGLPSGLTIGTGTGAISGTPDTADATVTVTVTVTDAAGNTDTVDITFPAVVKGDQTLIGFQYSPSSVTFGSTEPTVTEPTGAQTTLRYTARPDTVCTVVGSTGALTLVGAGECVVTATAEGTDNYNEADTSYTVTVQATGTLVLNLVEPIATDNVINAAEKKLGFKISGDTGAVGGVGVTVTVGGTDLPATSADADPATWSVSVPADASDITGTSLALRVSAAKAGYDSPADVERTLTVDLVAPTAPSYTAPSSLQVGVEITAMSPSGGSDIAEYSAAGLPSGLTIGTGTGAISGTPDTAEASTAGVTVTVTVSDTAGNTDTVDLTFPAVGKGDQPLSGFAYSADSVTFGSPAPTVTEPTGGQTNLSYLAPPETVCTVNPSTGALTIVGVGTCVITATAEGTDNYNEATARFTVTVQAADSLVADTLTLTVEAERDAVTEGEPVRYRIVMSNPTQGVDVGTVYRYAGEFLRNASVSGVTAIRSRRGVLYWEVERETVDDAEIEADGAFTVRLVEGDGYTLGTPLSATVRILDNDGGAPPGAPPRPGVSAVSPTTLEATWRAAPENGAPVTGYTLEYRAGASGAWSVWPEAIAPDARSVRLTGLTPGTEHEVRVRARCRRGAGPWSVPGEARTAPDPGVRVSVSTRTQIRTVEGDSLSFTVHAEPAQGSALRVDLRVTETVETLAGRAPTSVTIPAGQHSAGSR